MKKTIVLVAFLGATLVSSEEISVFDAGNINSENAYGLTENEQVLLKNKQNLDRINSTIKTQQEEIDGLRSVVEGANLQVSNLEQRVADLEIRTTGRVSSNSKVSTINKKEFEEMKTDIALIKEQIKQINAKLGLGSQKKNNLEVKKKLTSEKESPKVTSTQKPTTNAEILALADKLYKEKKYSEAKELYENLIAKNYKPAKSNFMIGEILYFQKDYSSALINYKKSLNLSDKTDFMPKLLYHCAISLDKIGDTQNANKFYSYLKSEFPQSQEAKAAPTRK